MFYRLPSLICSLSQKLHWFTKPFVRSLLPKSWMTLSHTYERPIFSLSSWPYCNMCCIEDTADALRNAWLEYGATASKLQPKSNLDRLLIGQVGDLVFLKQFLNSFSDSILSHKQAYTKSACRFPQNCNAFMKFISLLIWLCLHLPLRIASFNTLF